MKHKAILLSLSVLAMMPIAGRVYALSSGETSPIVSISFSPSSGVYGTNYTLSFSSENVINLNATCVDTNPDGSTTRHPFALSQYANTDKSWDYTVSENTNSTTCTLTGTNAGQTSTASASFTVLRPSCTVSPPPAAGVWWNTPSPINYGGSANESWNVVYHNLGNSTHQTVGNCGLGNINISDSGSYTFPSLTSNTTCNVWGTINGTQACPVSSATMQVNPAPAATGGKITVYSDYGGFQWKAQNGSGWSYSHVGAPAATGYTFDAPFGNYSLSIVDGWGGRVPTSITPSSASLSAPSGNSPNPGTVTCTDSAATNYGGPLPCAYPPAPAPTKPDLPPLDPDHRIILKLDPSGLISSLVHRVLAQTIPVISFQIVSRPAKLNYGTLDASVVGSNGSAVASGGTGDPADGYKTLVINKVLTRLSDGQSVTKVNYNWNNIVTDANGNWTTNTSFKCGTFDNPNVSDGSPYGDSDYQDVPWVIYDQGDHTGDSSPGNTQISKNCGGDFELTSVDYLSGNPVPVSWTLNGPHLNKNISQTQRAYSMRVNQGLQTLSITPPPGYTLQSSSFYTPNLRKRSILEVVNVVGAQTPGEPCSAINNACSFAVTEPGSGTNAIGIKVVWSSTGSGTTNPVVCSQTTPDPIKVGQPVSFSATGNFLTYSWSAPEGIPSSQSGGSPDFSTTFNSVGQKQVTVTSGGKNDTCTVNVTQPAPPQPTLVINPPSQTINVGQTAAYRALYDPDGPSGNQPEQDISASAVWTINSNIAQNQGGGFFKGVNSGSAGITATYPPNAPLTATAVLNVGGFDCSVSPNSITVPQGSSVQGNVSCSPLGSFGNQITFSSANVPANTTQNYSPNPITMPTISTYTFSAGQTSIPGAYTLYVVAQGGGITHQYPLNVTITGNGFSCNLQHQCVAGGGGASCTSDAQCAPPGLTCNIQHQCVLGGGGNSCTSSANCADGGSGFGCNAQNQCVFGGGNGSCSSNAECGGGGGNFHFECVSNTCARINTPGQNKDGCTSAGPSCTPSNLPPGSCTLTPSPSIINKGSYSDLSWPSSCGGSCSINGTPVSGPSLRVFPTQTTKYILSCSAGTASTTVKVSSLQEENPGP